MALADGPIQLESSLLWSGLFLQDSCKEGMARGRLRRLRPVT